MRSIKTIYLSCALVATATCSTFAADNVIPKGPPDAIPSSLEDIEDCTKPVVMVVFGEVSEEGFEWEHPSGRDYGVELRNSDLYKRFGGFYMTSSKILETFENPYPQNRFTLLAEWPCLEAAQGFYYSAEYQDILRLREGSGTFQFTVYPKETIEDMHFTSGK